MALMPNASFRYVGRPHPRTYRGPIRRFAFLQDLNVIDEITEAVQVKR